MGILEESFELSNGVVIPKLGLGTWQSAPEDAMHAVSFALAHGYTHVDTAVVYRNEKAVGQAVRDSSIARDKLFVTSKVPAEIKNYAEAKAAIDGSLKEIGLDYLDLMLIHAPKPWSEMRNSNANNYDQGNVEVWQALTEAYQAGKLRSIGVSNFTVSDIENIERNSDLNPMVNQIRYHVGHIQKEVTSFCQSHNILVEGYSPIGTGSLLKDADIQKIAEKYKRSIPQICIRYLLEKGVLPLPKSVHDQYIIQNTEVDFSLEAADIEFLDSLNK